MKRLLGVGGAAVKENNQRSCYRDSNGSGPDRDSEKWSEVYIVQTLVRTKMNSTVWGLERWLRCISMQREYCCSCGGLEFSSQHQHLVAHNHL